MLSWSHSYFNANKCFSRTSECAMDSVVNLTYFVLDGVLKQKCSFNSVYFDVGFSLL